MPNEQKPLRPSRTPDPPKHLKHLDLAHRAKLFLTPDHQTHVTLPNGTAVPLYSEDFFTWYLEVFDHEHIPNPSSAQFSFVQRTLDAEAISTRNFQKAYLRVAKTGQAAYEIDLHNFDTPTINLNFHDWQLTAAAPESNFLRPLLNHPLPIPELSQSDLPTRLSKDFALNQEAATQLSEWLALAMLPDQQPPILVITGTKRDQAARKLRNLLDPVVHPLLEIPYTNRELGQLALTNNVLAFSIFKYIAPSKIEALNKLQNGMLVKLKEVNKRRGAIWSTVARPIIISAGEAVTISPNQINMEINEAGAEDDPSQLFGALLSMMVKVLNQIHSKPVFDRISHAPKPPSPPNIAEFSNAPYT